jgi:two-component system alkaline phosphatase synthesis response regulator PhoP
MSSETDKILIVDDEPDIIEFIGYNLRKEGFDVKTCNNGREAVKIAKAEIPDLILLDVMMPEMDGIETCQEIRQLPDLANTIIAFLTARGEDYSQIAGLEAGADDYITKPVKPKVLLSRIKALLRRKDKQGSKKEKGKKEGLFIDRDRYLVILDNKELTLPKKEFELLSLLASAQGIVFSRETILSKVWGEDVIVGDRTIDVHIRKLREKIGEKSIKTIKGVGYKYSD